MKIADDSVVFEAVGGGVELFSVAEGDSREREGVVGIPYGCVNVWVEPPARVRIDIKYAITLAEKADRTFLPVNRRSMTNHV